MNSSPSRFLTCCGFVLLVGGCGFPLLALAQNEPAAAPAPRFYQSTDSTLMPSSVWRDLDPLRRERILTPDTPRPPLPIFFPPDPPPLDGALSDEPNFVGSLVAPPQLQEHVNELYYPPLSTLLAGRALPRRMQTRLVTYQADKLALQNELQAKLESVKDWEAGARRKALEDFAREQTPKVAELEKTADQLREDLISTWGGADWNARRAWHLGERNFRPIPDTATRDVVRAAAFYQKGLSPAQRRLLREVAMELAHPTNHPTDVAQNESYLFFSPETARIPVPANLSPELAAKIARYETAKSNLRKELFDAVVQHDGAFFVFLRSGAMRVLAEKQAPQFSELEALAEEIRVDLVGMPHADRSHDTAQLPSHLVKRMAEYREKQQTLNRMGLEMVQQIQRMAPKSGVAPVDAPIGSALRITVTDQSVSPAELEKLQRVVEKFNRDYSRNSRELVQEKEDLRSELARLFSAGRVGRGRSVDTLLAEFNASLQQREQWMVNQDYKTAVFEPGLSPEQRRLLFDAAMVRLELPLPNGDLQPN